MNRFQAVTDVLASRTSPLKVFFRDDDAGWADERLQELLAEFIAQELPLDLAVIPQAITERTSEVIKRAFEKSDMINVHQHGFSHTNHQRSGRSSEFGSDRDYRQQRHDIEAGKSKMAAVFGSRPLPIFTPPWNRCTGNTAAVLKSLDIQFLSRIVGSDSLETDLPELPVSIDWLKKRKGVSLNIAELVNHMCNQLNTEEAVLGVMLHHEHMDQDNRHLLLQFIEALKDSQRVSFCTMSEAAELATRRFDAR